MFTQPALSRTVICRKLFGLLLAGLAVFTCALSFARVCSAEEAQACCSMSCCKVSAAQKVSCCKTNAGTIVPGNCCYSRERPGDITTATFFAPIRPSLLAGKVACPAGVEAYWQRAVISSFKYWNSNHRAHAPPYRLYILNRALLI